MLLVRRARAAMLLTLLVTFLVGGCTASAPKRPPQSSAVEDELPVVSALPTTTPALPAPVPDDINIDVPPERPVVAGVRTTAGTLLAGADGGVFALSRAAHFSGSMGGRALSEPVVALAADPAGTGYWLAGADGGVFAFNRPFLGPRGLPHLSGPIAAMAATPSGAGYWLAGADGGVFAYGDAPYLGGQANRPLSNPIVGMAPTPDGAGYWLVASDGGVFAYGSASFLGSPAAEELMAPVVGVLSTPSGRGYWLASADGGVFAYGDAAWLGSPLNVGRGAVVAITAAPNGYRLVTTSGALLAPGDKPVSRPAPAPSSERQAAPTVSRSQRSRTPVTAAPIRRPATTATTASPAPAPTAAVASSGEIVAAMNRARASAGLGPLASDSRLASLATGWCRSLAQRNVLVHNDLSTLLADSSWSSVYARLGENIYTGAVLSGAAIVSSWMGSAAHRSEILMAAYDRVGVGIVVTGNRLWVVANFGDGR